MYDVFEKQILYYETGIKEKQSEAMLLAIQDAETEKQWRKRYAAWGKEAMQRRLLMEEVLDQKILNKI